MPSNRRGRYDRNPRHHPYNQGQPSVRGNREFRRESMYGRGSPRYRGVPLGHHDNSNHNYPNAFGDDEHYDSRHESRGFANQNESQYSSLEQQVQREIGVMLVDAVQLHHFHLDGPDNSRVMQITNKERSGSQTNIMAKILLVKDGWAGNIDNKDSLSSIYKLIDARKVSFIFAATHSRNPPSTATTCDMTPGVLKLFLPNFPLSERRLEMVNYDATAQQVNITAAVDGWKDIWMGNADNLQALVEIYNDVPSDRVSFIIAGNQ
ncbi:hypothetical protein ACHAPJ_002738 [Fusarium lateritium]